MSFDHVNYDVLDSAKQAFVAASRRTLDFAAPYGFVPDAQLGASANVFSLDLSSFLKDGQQNIYTSLLVEGLGTADDARPDDLTEEEAVRFWYNIAFKTMGALANDAAAASIQPLLVALYLPSADPELVFGPAFMRGFLDGFVEACRQVGCVYFSGETPQLKSKFIPGTLDIAGALWGIVPDVDSGQGENPTASHVAGVQAGDNIVFVESAGFHANGYTTLRKLATELPQGYRTTLPNGQQYWEAINDRTILYSPFVQRLRRSAIVPTNIEPITGHGWQKLMRTGKPLRYFVETLLPVPAAFSFVQQHTNMTDKEMLSVFNYGVGLAIFTRTQEEAMQVVAIAAEENLNACIAGYVEEAPQREVVVPPLNVTLAGEGFALEK